MHVTFHRSFFFFPKPLSTPFSRRTSQYFFFPRSRVRPRSSAAVAFQRRCGASLLKQPSLSLSLRALLYNDIIKSTLAFNPPPSPLNLPLAERLCNVDLGIPAARVGIELSYFALRSPPCCVVLCRVVRRARQSHGEAPRLPASSLLSSLIGKTCFFAACLCTARITRGGRGGRGGLEVISDERIDSVTVLATAQ